jgi:hypothetical protein
VTSFLYQTRTTVCALDLVHEGVDIPARTASSDLRYARVWTPSSHPSMGASFCRCWFGLYMAAEVYSLLAASLFLDIIHSSTVSSLLSCLASLLSDLFDQLQSSVSIHTHWPCQSFILPFKYQSFSSNTSPPNST